MVYGWCVLYSVIYFNSFRERDREEEWKERKAKPCWNLLATVYNSLHTHLHYLVLYFTRSEFRSLLGSYFKACLDKTGKSAGIALKPLPESSFTFTSLRYFTLMVVVLTTTIRCRGRCSSRCRVSCTLPLSSGCRCKVR